MSNFKRETQWSPAYDRREEGCGIHSVEVQFLLKGEKGTLQFVLATGWYRHTNEPGKPFPMFLWLHTPTPQQEGQQACSGCPWLDGRPCYHDGSYIMADDVFQKLVYDGEEAMWSEMERFYHLWTREPEKAVA